MRERADHIENTEDLEDWCRNVGGEIRDVRPNHVESADSKCTFAHNGETHHISVDDGTVEYSSYDPKGGSQPRARTDFGGPVVVEIDTETSPGTDELFIGHENHRTDMGIAGRDEFIYSSL